MAITNYDFPEAIKGDTYSQVNFTVTDGEETPNPIDLTGVNIYMFLKEAANNSNRVASFSSEPDGGIELTDPVNGKFSFNPGIIEVPKGKWVYDIQFFLTDGTTKTWIGGKFTVCQDVTDRVS